MGFSFFYGKQDRLHEREKMALRNGFVSGGEAFAAIALRRTFSVGPEDGGIKPPLQLPRMNRGSSAGRHP